MERSLIHILLNRLALCNVYVERAVARISCPDPGKSWPGHCPYSHLKARPGAKPGSGVHQTVTSPGKLTRPSQSFYTAPWPQSPEHGVTIRLFRWSADTGHGGSGGRTSGADHLHWHAAETWFKPWLTRQLEERERVELCFQKMASYLSFLSSN